MDRSIARRLNRLNRDFYDALAAEFARSRARLHAGIERALVELAPFDTVLDLGCGDGRVGRALKAGKVAGLGPWKGTWTGVDASVSLLGEGEKVGPVHRRDLDEPGWSQGLEPAGYDVVVAFSVLHHLPDASSRLECLRETAALLAPGGRFALSVWQLTHLERFRKRRRDWSEIGVAVEQVEPGDMLLDWRRGGEALRYVHEFDEAELRTLCLDAGLRPERAYRSDGETEDLGFYLLGRRAH